MQDLTRRDAIFWGASLAAGSLLPAAAQAKDISLTMVSASPVQFIWNKVIADVFVPEVTKAAKALGDNIAWKQLYGTTVKRGGEIQAVRDGISEMAFPTMTAYVSELPLQNISYVPPYGAGDMGAVSAAMHELNLTDPGIAESYKRYENTYLCNYVTPSYQLWTKFPVNSVADIKGVKLGCSGLTTGWIKGTGAVPVEQHIPGFYNDIQNGVFDGALTWLWVGESIKLAEVAPYVTIVNFGAVCPSIISISSKVWAGFSPELRAAFMKGGEAYMREVIAQQAKLEGEAVDKLKAKGAKIREVSFEERVKWAAVLDEVPGEWAEAVEKSGAPAKAALKRYFQLLESKGIKPVRQWKV
jgi:TRAP-type transport system periplasmic protein